MLPIEKGCIAIVTRGFNKDTIVEVGEFVGRSNKLLRYDDLWEVDKKMIMVYPDGRRTKGQYMMAEQFLQRLSGPPTEDVDKEEELVLIEIN